MKTLLSAIILAAGESRRMGQPKLLLPLGDKTVIEHAVASMFGSGVDELIVVLGDQAKAVRGILSGLGVKTVVNQDYKRGMSSSLVAGLRAVDPQTQAVLIALGDLPLLRPASVKRLIRAYVSGQHGIVVPVYQGQRGHPVLFDLKYRAALEGLRGDTGAREILTRHPEDVLEVTVSDAGVRRDIDTAEDYRAAAN